MRVGVGRPESAGGQVDHVLGKMPPREREAVREASLRAADAVEAIIGEGIDAAMSRYNTTPT